MPTIKCRPPSPFNPARRPIFSSSLRSLSPKWLYRFFRCANGKWPTVTRAEFVPALATAFSTLDDLPAATLRAMGFKRIGPQLAELGNTAIQQAVAAQRIRPDAAGFMVAATV